jgi:tRNA(adenine34) deaminase
MIEEQANPSETDLRWMRHALALAEQGRAAGEVPVGAVLVYGDAPLGEGWNQPIGAQDATAHAEIVAIRAAGAALGNYRLLDTTLYVTLEPCLMCVGAIVHARIKRVVFGANEPKTGAAGSVFSLLEAEQHNHRVQVLGGVLGGEAGELLRRFFRERREASRPPL